MSKIRCDNWTPFQQSVGEWAEKTFPQSTPESIVRHLTEEVEELGNAVYVDADGIGQFEEEAGDCLLLLLHLAHKMNFSLIRAAARKHAINLYRTYETEDNGRGYWKHVGPAAPTAEEDGDGS